MCLSDRCRNRILSCIYGYMKGWRGLIDCMRAPSGRSPCIMYLTRCADCTLQGKCRLIACIASFPNSGGEDSIHQPSWNVMEAQWGVLDDVFTLSVRPSGIQDNLLLVDECYQIPNRLLAVLFARMRHNGRSLSSITADVAPLPASRPNIGHPGERQRNASLLLYLARQPYTAS